MVEIGFGPVSLSKLFESDHFDKNISSNIPNTAMSCSGCRALIQTCSRAKSSPPHSPPNNVQICSLRPYFTKHNNLISLRFYTMIDPPSVDGLAALLPLQTQLPLHDMPLPPVLQSLNHLPLTICRICHAHRAIQVSLSSSPLILPLL